MNAEIELVMFQNCSNILQRITSYVLPYIQLTAIIASILNAVFFKSWKSPLYRYFYVNSLTEVLLLILQFLSTQTFCSKNLGLILTNWFQYYHFYGLTYLSAVVFRLIGLISIQIASDRYFIIRNGFTKKQIQGRMMIFILISFALYLPNLGFYEISKVQLMNNSDETIFLQQNANSTSNLYFIFFNEFVTNRKLIPIIVHCFQYLFTIVGLVMMGFYSIRIYKYYKSSCLKLNFRICYAKRCSLNEIKIYINHDSNKKKFYKENRVTIMIIWMSCVFMIDQIFMELKTTSKFALQLGTLNYQRVLTVLLFYRAISSILSTLFIFKYYKEYRVALKSNSTILTISLIFITMTIIILAY